MDEVDTANLILRLEDINDTLVLIANELHLLRSPEDGD